MAVSTAVTRGGGVLVLAWGALTGALIGLGEAVRYPASVTAFDRHVTAFVVAHRTAALDTIMKASTWLGSWVALIVAGGLLSLLTARRRIPIMTAVLAVVAWAGEAAGTAVAKNVVRRPRPPRELWLTKAHGWSWPSGHTAVAVVVFTTLALVVWAITHNRALRLLTSSSCVLAIAVVGFSRIELGVHWATDVVASILFVGSWLVSLRALPPAVSVVLPTNRSHRVRRPSAGLRRTGR